MDLHSVKTWLFPFPLILPVILESSCLHIRARLAGHQRAQTISQSGDLLVTYSHSRSVYMEKNPLLSLNLKPSPKVLKPYVCWERSHEDKIWRAQLGCCRWFRLWKPGSHPSAHPFSRETETIEFCWGRKIQSGTGPLKVSGPWIRWPQNAFFISTTTDIGLTWAHWEFLDQTPFFFFFFHRESQFI